jgi:hypothetical protein
MPPSKPNQVTSIETADSRWNWLYTIGGAAALVVFVLFLIGIIGTITAGRQPTAANDWFTQLQNNWLVVLFKLNAGFSGVQPDLLRVLNLLDIVVMALFGTLFLALYVALRRTNKVWPVVAASLPFLGMAIFLITSTAGRSGLLVGGLIISAVMLRSRIRVFSTVSAYVGLVASAVLFFAGDLGTAIFSSSNIIAILIGIGYVLWMIWFGLIARRLFQLGQGVSHEGANRN